MSADVINYLIIGLAFLLLGVGGGGCLIWKILVSRQSAEEQKTAEQQRHSDLVRLTDEVRVLGAEFHSLRESIKGNSEGLGTVTTRLGVFPELVDGLTKMCQEFARRTDAFNEAVELLQSTVAPDPNNGYADYAEDTPASRRTQQREEIKELMRRGVPADEAEGRVTGNEMWRQFTYQRPGGGYESRDNG